ncbi:MAG: acetylglutamate kinase [Pirellulales bacterium]|nr:acetylglutamate kinase [Pirellulales bacterium]
MQQAIEKADVLIEALGWIRALRDKVTVIKLGGSVMEDETALAHLLLDVVFMETVGMRPVIVHGGGAAISRAMEAEGLSPQFVEGRRVTDAAALALVERVLAEEVNEKIANKIEELGGRSMPLNFQSSNVLFGRPLRLEDRAGQPVDLGFVAEVTRVERSVIENFCYAGTVPVIPSMCLDVEDETQKYNVNADTAARAVAESLGAEKLVLLSDVSGVCRDKANPASLISTLSPEEADALIASGIVDAGMIPKVQACLETLRAGVAKAHIIDGRLRHSLLLEVYTNQGVGTQILRDSA